MRQLNYNHLYYFYITAKQGSIAKACEILHLTPQTVSSQIAVLEESLKVQLFERRGKRLILNPSGEQVFAYAEDIFTLGNELVESLQPQHLTQQLVFTVGVTDVIPKAFSFDFLRPIFDGELAIKLICREGEMDQLLAEMAVNKLDMILADCPIPPGRQVKAYSHTVSDCGLTFYIAANQAANLSTDFPANLNGQNMLIPGDQSSIKLLLISWLNDHDIHPNVVAEFDDSALAKLFGQAGYGIFCTPSNVEQHVLDNYQVKVVGRTDEIKEQLYMISSEKQIKHPAALALANAYRQKSA